MNSFNSQLRTQQSLRAQFGGKLAESEASFPETKTIQTLDTSIYRLPELSLKNLRFSKSIINVQMAWATDKLCTAVVKSYNIQVSKIRRSLSSVQPVQK